VKDLTFPLAAIALVFLVVIPLATLLSRAVLKRTRRRASWVDYGRTSVWMWLVAPTALPLAWLAAEGHHQGDAAHALETCLLNHGAGGYYEAQALLGALIGTVLVTAVLRFNRERVRFIGNVLPDDHPLARRVASLASKVAGLAGARIKVATHAPASALCFGWWRPRIIVDAAFADASSDGIITAALHHEAAHASSRDPMLGFVVRLALALNPAGRLLRADYERWRHAREALCDTRAVAKGCDPLDLAESLVAGARFQPTHTPIGVLALCGHDAAILRLRIELLLTGGAQLSPVSLGSRLLWVAAIAIVLMPHPWATGALEQFHVAVERLAFF
jgi:hypothetical protein